MPRGEAAPVDAEGRWRDRRLIFTIIGALLVGVGLSLIGGLAVWWDFVRGHGMQGARAIKGLVGAIVVGPVLIAIAVTEARHRVRRGAQEPGRHTRKSR